MRNKWVVLVVILLAVLIRFISIAERPMHNDEAVNAFKLADLLETGTFIYDRNEYHGPSLYYLTVIPAWLKSQCDLQSLGEKTLRTVPALAGAGLILLLVFLPKYIGWPMVIVSSLLLTISPALVFYSRYYIHEMLLVLFNAGMVLFLFRYSRSGKRGWLIPAGIFAGLMFATKETWIILVGCQFIAFLIVKFLSAESFSLFRKKWNSIKFTHLLLFMFPAILVAVLLYASFFKNPKGIADSLLTFSNYFNRASGEAVHVQPWYYYFQSAFMDSCTAFCFRADTWLFAAGFLGMVLVFFQPKTSARKHPVMMFVAITALLTAVVFSAIPYKTPWNMLSFYIPVVFMAAWFFCKLYESINTKGLKILYLFFSIVIAVHLGWQVYADNFKFYNQPCNPYVYSHPDDDVFKILREVEEIAATAPEGKDIFIEVIVSDNGYWPLPWYLRTFPNAGWWNEVDLNAPAAPLIICDRANSDQLTKKLFEIPEPGKRHLYIPVNDELSLRPGTNVSVYLRKDYWDRYRRTQQL